MSCISSMMKIVFDSVGWLSKYRLLYKAPVFDIPSHLNPHLKFIIFDTYSWSCMSGIWQLLFMQVIYVLLEACDIKYNGQCWVLWEVWSVQSSVWCMQRTVTSVQSAVWSVQCKMWCAVSGMQNQWWAQIFEYSNIRIFE